MNSKDRDALETSVEAGAPTTDIQLLWLRTWIYLLVGADGGITWVRVKDLKKFESLVASAISRLL